MGTVVRTASTPLAGELIRLNWKTKRVEAKVPIFPSNPDIKRDPNPRGGTRGCRGIEYYNGTIISANYHTLKFFDLNLKHLKDCSHGLMADIHEISLSNNGDLWVCSTALDGALKVNIESGQLKDAIWPRELPNLSRLLNLDPLNFDKNQDNRLLFIHGGGDRPHSHLHLNAAYEWEGRIFALFNAHGIIADLTEDRIAVSCPTLKAGHDLIILKDGTALVNDTMQAAVRFYNLEKGKLIDTIFLKKLWVVKRLLIRGKLSSLLLAFRMPFKGWRKVIAASLFLRGMDVVGDKLFVGLSPATILCLDLNTKNIVDSYRYTSDVRVSFEGLKVLDLW